MFRSSKRQAILAVAVIGLLCCGFTCNNDKSATVSRDVAASVKALQQAEITLHQTGKVTDPEHKMLQGYFKLIGQAGLNADHCIGSTAAVGCIDAAIGVVNNFSQTGIPSIKSDEAKQILQLSAVAVLNALNAWKAVS